MTWNDFYQRQHAIQAVLELAEHSPEDPLASAPEYFADDDQLLAALQYKWTQSLTGRIEIALEGTDFLDRPHAVAAAWRRTKAANPTLRALLDQHSDAPGPELRSALEREQRLLANLAGLAEATEPGDTVERIGDAFLDFLRGERAEPCDGAIRRLHGLTPSR